MSKRETRETRAVEKDAVANQSPPATTGSARKPVAEPVVNIRRGNLPALLIAASLWVGWLIFLVYVAATRQ